MTDQPQAELVQPHPVPMSWIINPIPDAEEPMIVVQVMTPQGSTILFVPVNYAMQLADEMKRVARTAATGLVVPKAASISDITKGLNGRG